MTDAMEQSSATADQIRFTLAAQAICRTSAHTSSDMHEQQCAADTSSMHAIHKQANALPFALRVPRQRGISTQSCCSSKQGTRRCCSGMVSQVSMRTALDASVAVLSGCCMQPAVLFVVGMGVSDGWDWKVPVPTDTGFPQVMLGSHSLRSICRGCLRSSCWLLCRCGEVGFVRAICVGVVACSDHIPMRSRTIVFSKMLSYPGVV